MTLRHELSVGVILTNVFLSTSRTLCWWFLDDTASGPLWWWYFNVTNSLMVILRWHMSVIFRWHWEFVTLTKKNLWQWHNRIGDVQSNLASYSRNVICWRFPHYTASVSRWNRKVRDIDRIELAMFWWPSAFGVISSQDATPSLSGDAISTSRTLCW